MTIELPILRLGLAGFSSEEQQQVATTIRSIAMGVVHWDLCELDKADAWLVNGSRVQELGQGRIRIGPGVPTARAVQLDLADVDRPMAFSKPCKLAGANFTFDMGSRPSLAAVLHKFEGWLAPVVAQFCLAAHIVEHQTALRSGMYDLTGGSTGLLAVVNMHGEAAVLPTAGPAEFDEASWGRQGPDYQAPENFVRATMSHLMWQYSSRTQRDVLPAHYRTGAIYFRRAPRVAQRLLDDTDLYLLRELSAAPATFDALQRRSGLLEEDLAHHLAALYFVGSITSNPKRAANPPIRTTGDSEVHSGPASNLPSGLDSVPPDMGRRPPVDPDLTAPAPMVPR